MTLLRHIRNQDFTQKLQTAKLLTLWHPVAFRDFREKNTETHVVLSRNFSSPVNTTDPGQKLKRLCKSCSLHSKKNFLVGGADFL